MDDIIKGIRKLKSNFDACAKIEGDKKTLTKQELSLMLRNELGGTTNSELNYFFTKMDDDQDKVVTFSECLDFVFEAGKILAT